MKTHVFCYVLFKECIEYSFFVKSEMLTHLLKRQHILKRILGSLLIEEITGKPSLLKRNLTHASLEGQKINKTPLLLGHIQFGISYRTDYKRKFELKTRQCREDWLDLE